LISPKTSVPIHVPYSQVQPADRKAKNILRPPPLPPRAPLPPRRSLSSISLPKQTGAEERETRDGSSSLLTYSKPPIPPLEICVFF